MNFTWHRPGSLGDLIATLNLKKNFEEKYPGCEIAYKIHPEMKVVIKDLILSSGIKYILDSTDNYSYGKQINLIGYPIPPKGNHPHEPMKKHLIEYFAEELEVNPDFDSLRLPLPEPVMSGEYATVHVRAGWSQYKNWKYENWNQVCWNLMRAGIKVIQIGGPDDPVLPNTHGVISVRGNSKDSKRVHFNTCLSAMAHAKVHMGIDSWSNNATNILWGDKGRTPAVILWGSSQVEGTGYKTNINISKRLPCQPCFKEDPRVSSIPLDPCENLVKSFHRCMSEIEPKEVYDAVMSVWEKKETRL